MPNITYTKFVDEMFSYRKEWLQTIYSISKIGNIFNEPSKRFLKADMVETACEYAIKDLTYVDDIGHDFLYKGQYRVSNKSAQKAFNKNGTNSIKVANTLGSKTTIIDHNFDAMIIIQKQSNLAIAIAPFNIVREYSKAGNDGYYATIPKEHLDYIIEPNEKIDSNVDFNEEHIEQIYKSFIKNVVMSLFSDNDKINMSNSINDFENIKQKKKPKVEMVEDLFD